MRISARNAVDLLGLAGTELLVGIEAPRAFEQALATEHFVDAGNAAGEIVGGVEDHGVRVGQFDVEPKHFRWNRGVGQGELSTLRVKLDRTARPDSPLSEQAANNAPLDMPAIGRESKRGEQIHDDVVVVTGVERDVLAARFSKRAHDVDGLVTIERG